MKFIASQGLQRRLRVDDLAARCVSVNVILSDNDLYPMVPTLLANWGITCTKDVGEIVFHLIAEGIFSKSEDDRIEDFENVYDFHTAFVAPFLPGGFTPMSASS